MVNGDYRTYFIRQMHVRRTVFLGLIVLFWIVPPLGFFLSEYQETMGYGIEKLGVERYQERMKDTLKYTLWMSGVLSVLFFPFGLILLRFFSAYSKVLKKMNAYDINRLRAYTDLSKNWLRFVPSFIFCGDKLYLFKMIKTDIHRLPDIIGYHLQKNFSSGNFRFYHYRLNINTPSGHYTYGVLINDPQATMLQQDLYNKKDKMG